MSYERCNRSRSVTLLRVFDSDPEPSVSRSQRFVSFLEDTKMKKKRRIDGAGLEEENT
jgi:hypothetical protein